MSIMDEIKLFLAAHDKVWTYCHFVEKHITTIQPFQSMIYKLPSQYDLVRTTHFANPPRRYYRTRYAVYSSPTQDTISRPVVLSNTESLLSFMRTQVNTVIAALSTAELRTEHDALYHDVVDAFHVWIEVARPLCMPSLAALRARQQGGRLGVGSRSNLTGVPLLLTRLRSLVEQSDPSHA